ncbi:Integral membrane protein [Caldisalinibacter kiritimatiensis]|uniref:Integral membrane protein n=2 Tax=Caldisalinibacter kiritimatiensis TaxID=1304284 RepID=R1CYQ3_9FIRM|nr:Integral membrane protein [Caldisalinibacter kiritimatiensis]
MRDNPEIGPLEAISQSIEMMDGHKMRLFVLVLSFIGWFLLGIITFGIGLIWVIPYYRTTIANFYQDLIGNENYSVE